MERKFKNYRGSILSILVVLMLMAISSAITSATSLLPIPLIPAGPRGQINNLHGINNNISTTIFFSTKNVGTVSGTIWSKVYVKINSTYTQIYSRSENVTRGSYYNNIVVYLSGGIVYQYKITVGHGSKTDDTKYITI
jgi:uncharacterized protein YxeA